MSDHDFPTYAVNSVGVKLAETFLCFKVLLHKSIPRQLLYWNGYLLSVDTTLFLGEPVICNTSAGQIVTDSGLYLDHKIYTGDILKSVARGDSNRRLGEEETKKYSKYVHWYRWNDKTVYGWDRELGSFLVSIDFLIYLVLIYLSLLLIKRKNK